METTRQVSNYLADRIDKPKYLRLTPLRQGRSSRPVVVVGWDTEASKGKPILFQFSTGGEWQDATLIDIPDRENAGVAEFVRWVDRNCRTRRTEYLIFGFNLQYEWTQLFGDLPSEISTLQEFSVVVEVDDCQRWKLNVMNFRRHAMIMTGEQTHVRVRVLDAGSFYPGSLASVAKMVGVEDKEDMDKAFLSNLTRATASDPAFRRYAAQDAVTTRLVGERVVAMHEEFDVTTCISAPQLASKVYRRQFLRAEILLPDKELEQAGLLSYHGGKNGYYHKGPLRTEAWNLDIVSAYPEAMRILPAVEGGRWNNTTKYREGVHGLWQVRLDHKPCRYGGLFDHDGRRLGRGTSEVWATSYELDVMLAYGEARRFDILAGFVLEPGEGESLVTYVDRFFAEKRTTAGPARATAKLMLNSLYGKFFQKQPVGTVKGFEGEMDEDGNVRIWQVETDPNQQFDYRAGGLYHPPIASLITGFVRAKIHDLEHRQNAIATSTDGLFATKAPDPTLVGDGLGMLTADHGHLDIWRERLYQFGEVPSGPVNKFALHGFRGKLRDLQEIPLEPGTYRYNASHPVTLREAQTTLRGVKYRPGEFAMLDFVLDLEK